MRAARILTGAVAFLLTLNAPAVQGGERVCCKIGSEGWGPRGPYGRLYDVAKEVTIEGEIVAFERHKPMMGMSRGVHIKVRMEDPEGPDGKAAKAQMCDVHLGPTWFLDRQDVPLEIGDRIAVTGSQTSIDGKATIIARKVVKGDMILVLRDETGRPVWAGWRPARPVGR